MEDSSTAPPSDIRNVINIRVAHVVIMSRKNSKCDDLIEAFKDPKVIETLTTNLSDQLSKLIEKAFETYIEKINVNIATQISNAVQKQIDDLSEKFNPKQDMLETSLSSYNTKLVSFDNRITTLDKNTRSYQLIFVGIPENPVIKTDSKDKANLSRNMNDVESIVSIVNMGHKDQIGFNHIADIRRISNNKLHNKRDILVTFASALTRDAVFKDKIQIRKNAAPLSVFINEPLTPENLLILKSARTYQKLKKIASAWTWHGDVYYKKTATCKPAKLSNLSQLQVLNLPQPQEVCDGPTTST